jgi:hypothetical protein
MPHEASESEWFVRDRISCNHHIIYAFMCFPDFINCVYGDNQKQLLFVGGLFDSLMVFDLAELSEPYQLQCLLDVERTGKVIVMRAEASLKEQRNAIVHALALFDVCIFPSQVRCIWASEEFGLVAYCVDEICIVRDMKDDGEDPGYLCLQCEDKVSTQ